MKTVVRNNNKEEGTQVQDTWYLLVSEDEVRCGDISSPLWSSEGVLFVQQRWKTMEQFT